MKEFIYQIMNFLVGIPITLFKGLAISKLWLWFIVPLGVMPIGVIHGVGLAVILVLFTGSYPHVDKDEDSADIMIRHQIFSVMLTGLCFLSGYIYHLFM